VSSYSSLYLPLCTHSQLAVLDAPLSFLLIQCMHLLEEVYSRAYMYTVSRC
jgi:hypothetical protein